MSYRSTYEYIQKKVSANNFSRLPNTKTHKLKSVFNQVLTSQATVIYIPRYRNTKTEVLTAHSSVLPTLRACPVLAPLTQSLQCWCPTDGLMSRAVQQTAPITQFFFF